ncbi:MAG: SURF1 family cytochrome oxidase biogenesis protein [Kineosporiaceae bacterium]
MLRTAVSPRGAGLTVLAAAAVAVLAGLGVWQWERSRPVVDTAALTRVPLTDVVPVQGRLVTADQGAPVTVAGTWRPDRQLLVADRDDPSGTGTAGRWVVTAVEVAPATPGDPAVLVPVVRGWVAADPGDPAADVAAPPAGSPARVRGWVQASEPLDTPVEVVQPDGVVALLAAADLANRWPEHVLDAFVLAEDAPGTDPAALSGVDRTMPGPVQAARGTRDWRNVAYAAQWWVFAGFAVVLWWRAMGDVAAAAARDRAGREPTNEEVPA